jgi:hypothetical protein
LHPCWQASCGHERCCCVAGVLLYRVAVVLLEYQGGPVHICLTLLWHGKTSSDQWGGIAFHFMFSPVKPAYTRVCMPATTAMHMPMCGLLLQHRHSSTACMHAVLLHCRKYAILVATAVLCECRADLKKRIDSIDSMQASCVCMFDWAYAARHNVVRIT